MRLHLRLGLNPRLAGVKHLNRLEQVLARTEWGDEGIREGLLLDMRWFRGGRLHEQCVYGRERRVIHAAA